MKRTVLPVLILALALCLALAGCGGAGGNYSTGGTPGAGGQEGSGSAAEGSAVISYSMANVPLVDPGTASDEAATTYLCNVYDPLVFPTHEGGIEPWVATEWSCTEDGLTWTFKLRDDIKFHNGDPLTAEDVAFSMQRLLDLGEGFAYLFSDYVTSVSAPDDSTVVFTLSQPFATFDSALVRLYIVNKDQIMANLADGSFGENGDYAVNWLLAADAGSGPYKFEELAANQYVYGVKFDDYWGGWDKDAPAGFKIYGTTEAVTIRTMMSRHELEISDGYQTLEALNALDGLDQVDITAFSSAGITYLSQNNQKAPTDDVHFRKALAHLIDYSTIVEALYPNCKVATNIISEALPGYEAGVFNYEYSLEQAEEELKQSQYNNDLASYPVEVVWNPENVEREQFFLVFQTACAQLGIKVNITQKTWIQVMEDAASPETTPNCFLIWTCPSYPDAGSILKTQYTIHDVGTWETMDWVNDPEIDAEIKEAVITLDETARIAMYQDIIRKLVDNCVTIPVVEMYESHAYQTGYFYWDVADRASQGQPVTGVMGYPFYVKNMKVYPDKR